MTEKRINVLLVEDDQIDVMGVQRAFKSVEFVNPVIVAGNGLEALEKLRDNKSVPRPFLILLDLNMPRMGGHEFLAELRKDKDLHDSIVFVLTTSKADEDKFRAYQHNVAGYLVKGKVGDGFMDAVKLLDSYWRLVEFP